MTQTSVKAQPQQTSTQAGTLVLNQVSFLVSGGDDIRVLEFTFDKTKQ